MAYGLRYTITAIGRSNQVFTAEIYERDYAGSADALPPDYHPFIQSLLAQNDEQFNPVQASTLDLSANISQFTGTLPDFTSQDQKKYWVKLKSGAYAGEGAAVVLARNYQGGIGIRKSTLTVLINGVPALTLSGNGTSDVRLVISAGDIITFQQSADGGVFIGSTWGLDVDDVTSTLFSDSTSSPTSGVLFEYSIIAASGVTYRGKAHVAGDVDMPSASNFDLWQGFALFDGVQVPFSTGYRRLGWQNTDGLALLKSVAYEPSSTNINDTETLLQIILNCLNKIELPEGFYLNICVSVFALGMVDRGAAVTNEPFSQIKMFIKNWINTDQEYDNCYSILEKICLSFGCQIMQAGTQYFIISVAERFDNQIYYTTYDQDGSLIDGGLAKLGRTLKPYVDGDTTPVYFVNNSQVKVSRSGYPKIEMRHSFNYAPNMIGNGNLKQQTAGFPDYFMQAGTGTLSMTLLGPYIALSMGVSTLEKQVYAMSLPKLYAGDTPTLSFILSGYTSPSATPAIRVYWAIETSGGVVQYSLNSDHLWVLGAGVYCNVMQNSTALFTNISITAPRLPINADSMVLFFELKSGVTLNNAQFGNFSMTVESDYEYRQILASVSEFTYKKSVEIPLGAQEDDNMGQNGALLDSALVPYHNWYRFGYSENYPSLMRLLIQQYANVQTVAQINLQSEIRSIFAPKDTETEETPYSAIDTIFCEDTTQPLNVAGLSYISGNLRLNYAKDEISGTVLQVNNTEVAADITDTIVEKQ